MRVYVIGLYTLVYCFYVCIIMISRCLMNFISSIICLGIMPINLLHFSLPSSLSPSLPPSLSLPPLTLSLTCAWIIIIIVVFYNPFVLFINNFLQVYSFLTLKDIHIHSTTLCTVHYL